MSDDDNALDRLFGVPLGEFTATRDRLARELRKEGDADRAAEIAALRKPAVPVWVANQLARRHRREVDLLLDAGHRLRAAQSESDPAEAREAFQRAREAEREAMTQLREAAVELLREEHGRATEAMIERVMATLRAAAVTVEGRELLARGRLTEELTTTGFDVAATLVPAKPTRRTSKQDVVKSARAELQAAKVQERDASRRLRQADRRVAELRTELGAAEADAERARAAADKASESVASAETALERAQRKR